MRNDDDDGHGSDILQHRTVHTCTNPSLTLNDFSPIPQPTFIYVEEKRTRSGDLGFRCFIIDLFGLRLVCSFDRSKRSKRPILRNSPLDELRTTELTIRARISTARTTLGLTLDLTRHSHESLRATTSCAAEDGSIVGGCSVESERDLLIENRGDGACGKTSALNVFTRG